MSGLTQDGTAEPVPRNQFCRLERGREKHYFSLLSDHEQKWQPYSTWPIQTLLSVLTILTCSHLDRTPPPIFCTNIEKIECETGPLFPIGVESLIDVEKNGLVRQMIIKSV